MSKLFKRIEEIGFIPKITDSAKDYISDKGYDSAYGARPLKRAIQKYIEDLIAEKIISDNIGEGDKCLLILITKRIKSK